MVVVSNFIEPREVEIGGKTFTVSKIPAIPALKIYHGVMSAVKVHGDIGVTMLPVDVVADLFKYTAVTKEDGGKLPLDTMDRVNANISSVGELLELQLNMLKDNFGFLFDGRLQELLAQSVNGAMNA